MAEVTSAISIDSSVDMAEAKQTVGPATAVCGNVDVNTVLLFGEPADVEQATKEVIEKGTDLLTTSSRDFSSGADGKSDSHGGNREKIRVQEMKGIALEPWHERLSSPSH